MQTTIPHCSSTEEHRLLSWLTENTLRGMARRKALMGYAFLLPTIVGILVFTAGPVIVSLGLSLYRWSVLRAPVFVGTENYTRLAADPRVRTSFLNTVRFVILAVSLRIVVSLLLALGMQVRMPSPLRYLYRSAYFVPYLTSGVATGIVLGYMLHRHFGPVNYYLSRIGLPRIPWTTSSA
ncbi:MAG: sugar ABC transporter permease [Chloroflexi bacterium]|nr:sugar ABC transporter permease [Chloroflexota bacterium]